MVHAAARRYATRHTTHTHWHTHRHTETQAHSTHTHTRRPQPLMILRSVNGFLHDKFEVYLQKDFGLHRRLVRIGEGIGSHTDLLKPGVIGGRFAILSTALAYV